MRDQRFRRLRRTRPVLMRLLIVIICVQCMVPANSLPAGRLNQARSNYAALEKGKIRPEQLTPQERRDVLLLLSLLSKEDNRSRSQRCVDEELAALGSPASDLAMRIIDLKCREPGARSARP